MARSLSQLFFAMGGSVSPGKSNDELVDHLIDAEFIRTPAIQRVFRSVDRGSYYHSGQKNNAYKDIAWKCGNLHLSAPCVYSVVLEALKLKPGLSFLNLGSGSGYLSTMAGLLLGQYGINHGIEFHQEIVDYAYEKLDDFLKNSKVVDERDFCEPVFTCGNCLTFDSNIQLYDRVYCGAACPEEYESFIKNLVKVNGILIMPLNDKLLKITRVGENTWTSVKILSVSFAPLIPPPATKKGQEVQRATLGNIHPPTLQQLCRFQIRALLRSNIETEFPKLKTNLKKHDTQRSRLKLFVVNCETDTDADSSSSDEEELDSFSLMMRSIHRARFMLRGFTGEESVSSSEQEEEEEPIENVLQFTNLTTLQDANDPSTEEAGPSSSSNTDLKIAVSQDSATESENETIKKIQTRAVFKRSSLKAEKKKNANTCDCPPSKSDSNIDVNLILPPSMSTRSKTGHLPNLKRKRSIPANGPSTSKGNSGPPSKKKATGKSQPKKRKSSSSEAKKKTTSPAFLNNVKLDLNNKISVDFSHSYYITQRITSLPLPVYLMKYLNYKRDNF